MAREATPMRNKILWIAPNLNHYKVRQLNMLSSKVKGLRVLHGMTNEADGHRMPERSEFHFDRIQINCTKKQFGWKIDVYRIILRELKQHDIKIILMPMEKKHLQMILFLYLLKHLFKFSLVSYNHHYLRRTSNRNGLRALLDKKVVRFSTRLYNTVVYYTEGGMRFSLEEGMVQKSKAFFASNTIDVEHIFSITNQDKMKLGNNILFIGRILPSKRLDLLLEYFNEIKKAISDCKLFIIGEGPSLDKYKEQAKNMPSVYWLGGIVDEEIISKYARMSRIVFAPGASGLSIVHSFAYGKPYVTFDCKTHGPEIDYLINGKNGLILPSDDRENNIKEILRLLKDNAYYSEMSTAALKTAKQLTLKNWVKSMQNALDI